MTGADQIFNAAPISVGTASTIGQTPDQTPKSAAAWSLLAAANPAPWEAYHAALRTATPQQIMDAYLEHRAANPEFRRLYRYHVAERERHEAEARAVTRQIIEALAKIPDGVSLQDVCPGIGAALDAEYERSNRWQTVGVLEAAGR